MRKSFILKKVIPLMLLVVGVSIFYFAYNTYGNLEFALALRGKKYLAFLLVGLALSFATISFQTITHSTFLTPNLLGIDSFYVFIQTLLFFIVGGVQSLTTKSIGLFVSNVVLVGISSFILSYFLLKKGTENLFFLMMVGLVGGTFFRTFSTFLQILMDPNEYDLLQGKLFASFSQVNTNLLLVGGILIILLSDLFYKLAPLLDVLHLGDFQSKALGVKVLFLQRIILVGVSLLTAIATGMVGPVTFLGFVVANLSYQYGKTYRHQELFLLAFLWSCFLLILGDFLVVQVFHFQTPLSVVIEFIGGLYFLVKLVKERQG